MNKRIKTIVTSLSKKKLSPVKKKRFFTITIFSILIITIISIASSIFFPFSSNGFSELSLLMYNETSQTFEADGYPYVLESGENISLFFMVKNFENEIKYYQIQIKATKISQNATAEYPLDEFNSYLLNENETYEKILSPATEIEKRESGVFSGDYIWGPISVVLSSNAQLEAILDGDNYMKIVFELWEFDTSSSSFEYSGIFTFLQLWYYY